MASYRKVKNLSREDAAYIAGLIDGEGTLSLSRRRRGENRQFVISISNAEARLLNYVCRSVGAGRITRKRTSKSNLAPSGTYAIDNRQALDLLPPGSGQAIRRGGGYCKPHGRSCASMRPRH